MTDGRDPAALEPLQRRTYEAAALVRQHRLVLRNENKQLLFSIAAPPGPGHAGTLEYSRWPELPLPQRLELDARDLDRLVDVRDGYYDYRPVLDPGVGVEWHVNFADPNLFYAYGSALFAQDEIQVAEHPVLGSLREALVAEGRPATTIANGRPTPVLVLGAERRLGSKRSACRGVSGTAPERTLSGGLWTGYPSTNRAWHEQPHGGRRGAARSRPASRLLTLVRSRCFRRPSVGEPTSGLGSRCTGGRQSLTRRARLG
jgi:hypothetical protein